VYVRTYSEEVFDFSSGQMTQTKAKHLKDSMCSEFAKIFDLCQFVLDNSQNAPLVEANLETLLRFLNWIPLGYIFETKLINTLIVKVDWLLFWLTLKKLTDKFNNCAAYAGGADSHHFIDTQRLFKSTLKNI